MIREEMDGYLFVRDIPPHWFLYEAKEERTPIVNKGDQHKPTGQFIVAFQHIDGGRLQRGYGYTLQMAWTNAINLVRSHKYNASIPL